jgi:hypothetical protein
MKTNFHKGLYLGSTILRILLPLAIFKFPLFVVITVTFLDAIDGDLASQGVLSKSRYQLMDKLMDNWWYLWALLYSYFALNNFFVFLSILFIYRLVGLGIFLYRKNRSVFMFFPNFFENAFFLFLLTNLFGWRQLVSGNNLFYSLIVVFILKLLQEYWLHILRKSFVENVFKFKWRKWLPD